MAAFHLTVRIAVQGYHVYREVWVPTVDEKFYFRQEADNRADRYAVAVYGDTQSSTCMYSAWAPSLSNFDFCGGLSFMVIQNHKMLPINIWAHWTISPAKAWTAIIVTVQQTLPPLFKKANNCDNFHGKCPITFPFFSTATAFLSWEFPGSATYTRVSPDAASRVSL